MQEADAASGTMRRNRARTRPTCRHWKSSCGGACSRAHGGISGKLCGRSRCQWRWRWGDCIVLQLYILIIHPRVCCCARGPRRGVHGVPGIDIASLEHAAWANKLLRPVQRCSCNVCSHPPHCGTCRKPQCPGECQGEGNRQTCLMMALRDRLGSGTQEVAAGWDQRRTQSPMAALHTRLRAHHTCRHLSMRLQAAAQQHAASSSIHKGVVISVMHEVKTPWLQGYPAASSG